MIKKIFMITLFPFVGKNGVVKPNRVAISILLYLIIKAIWLKIDGIEYLSDFLISILMGQVSILITADTWRSNTRDKNNVDKN